ncbi:universal stress protein [Roseovarius sp. B08]|uniref:universal stress protein n=1 Tax=Roseovarius sp. B08 TaxID=3449223 RepID=UPI003EDC1816
MFKKIMAPVDLAHKERLEKALKCTGDLAKHYGAEVVFVGVTTTTPSSTAHTPKEYGEKLDAFAREQAQTHGITATGQALVSHDPSSDVDDVLLKATKDNDVDLVVMASHVPNIMDYVWPSNGGKIAEHANCSVMVVRS